VTIITAGTFSVQYSCGDRRWEFSLFVEQERDMNNQIRELSMDELDRVSGGNITVVADKDYVGIEISIGGYGFGVWVTGGSVCGAINTPSHRGGTCVPA
jgi:hypothetical protein